MRPSTGKSVRPNSSQKIFQLDLSKFADQWGTSSKPIIRPKKQLKTNLLHSVLYKMKMEKDILEEKIKLVHYLLGSQPDDFSVVILSNGSTTIENRK